MCGVVRVVANHTLLLAGCHGGDGECVLPWVWNGNVRTDVWSTGYQAVIDGCEHPDQICAKITQERKRRSGVYI